MPTVSAGSEHRSSANGTACLGLDARVHAVGARARITVAVDLVTRSCRCEYTTRNHGYSCAEHLDCESEYNVGATNPTKCTTLASEPEALTSVKAHADGDCTAVVSHAEGPKRRSSSRATATLTAPARTRAARLRENG